ncbi:MAG: glycerol-3-phosphate 1-O-acyltransferase PlsY [Acholeplasmatales bacterium]|nr:glycerol-3-phosphate 1-O-acyltransferase PlsY [Acholeplasmatales bacterium]MBR6289094.1 glycerol-3-phosphate 1-O-acyltransferase PlsY [Acholeplasmatales bacterium]
MFLTSNSVYEILIAIGLLMSSYIIGSIPFGVVLGKAICNIDIREHGSKNIGSTNAIRVLGKKVGFLIFFCDVLKGMIVILIVRILHATGVFYNEPVITSSYNLDLLLYGAAAIVGHSFPIFLNFKGGKGVATSLGVITLICPIAAALCLIAFAITLYTTGYVSLSSTFATLTVTITVWVFHFVGLGPDANPILVYLLGEQHLVTVILISTIALLIIVKHRKNYIRLLNGTENNFKKAKLEKKKQLENESQAN